MSLNIEMEGVDGGEDTARLSRDENGNLWVCGINEGGYGIAGVRLDQLLTWLDAHPEYLEEARRNR